MKKGMAILLCLALFVALFSGCGSSDKAKTDGSTGTVQTSGGTKETAQTSTVEEKEVTISFLHYKSDVTDAMNKIVGAFMSKNPKIKVQVDSVKYDNYDTLLQTRLASGDVIDVITLKPGATTSKYVKGDYLLELTGKPFLQNILDSALKASAVDGKNYTLPIDNAPIAVFYNKKIFKDVGVEVPKTYSDLMKVAGKIKARGITPFALAWKDAWPLAMWDGVEGMLDIYFKAGKTNWGNDLMAGKTTFKDTPEWKTVIRRSKDFYDNGQKNSLGTDYAGACDLMASGKAAMIFMGIWPLSDWEKKNPDFFNNDLGMFAYPATDNPDETLLQASVDVCLAIGKASKAQDQALKFLEFMASVEGGNLWLDNIKTLSDVKGTRVDIAPALNDVKPYFDSGKLCDSGLFYGQLPAGWDGELEKNLMEYILGTKTEDKVLEAMDKYIAKLGK